jgi:hypothetical protein
MSAYSHSVTRAAGDVIKGLCSAQSAARVWRVPVTSVILCVRELSS